MIRLLAVATVGLAVVGCRAKKEADGTPKTSAETRATRRAFDGAPPVIPHGNLGVNCTSCHDAFGKRVEGTGIAPASPHARTDGLSDRARCRQCHVFRTTDTEFRPSRFEPLAQNLRKGPRLYAGAPPVMPHDELMRENCTACHAGPAARAQIRTSHPERVRCRQCHASRARTADVFTR